MRLVYLNFFSSQITSYCPNLWTIADSYILYKTQRPLNHIYVRALLMYILGDSSIGVPTEEPLTC